jgi:hypothetical protein
VGFPLARLLELPHHVVQLGIGGGDALQALPEVDLGGWRLLRDLGNRRGLAQGDGRQAGEPFHFEPGGGVLGPSAVERLAHPAAGVEECDLPPAGLHRLPLPAGERGAQEGLAALDQGEAGSGPGVDGAGAGEEDQPAVPRPGHPGAGGPEGEDAAMGLGLLVQRGVEEEAGGLHGPLMDQAAGETLAGTAHVPSGCQRAKTAPVVEAIVTSPVTVV